MFSSISIYIVPSENADQFVRVQREALAILQDEGCLDEMTFAPADLSSKYGCAAFDRSVGAGPDEQVFVSVSKYHNRAHHDEVMEKVDADPRLSQLHLEMSKLLDTGRIVRGEFERRV
jgi:uncharacterized protein YbaA (DUF1428 family)